MQVDGFQWDEGNLEKCQKHGVTREETEAVFRSGTLFVFPDPNVSEPRLRGIGITPAGRHVFVIWTIRKAGELALVRPISVRFMHAKEIKHYEQARKATSQFRK